MALRKITDLIGIHFTTLRRELRRNAFQTQYDPKTAHPLSDARKRTVLKANKRKEHPDEIISERLKLGWSPQAINQQIALELQPEDTLSHTTI